MSIATITLQDTVTELEPGKSTEFQFTVSSDKDTAMRVGLRIEPKNKSHADLFELQGEVERDFDDGETQTVTVKATAPEESGDYGFKLRVYEADDPEASVVSKTATVKVKAADKPVEKKEEKKGGTPIWPFIVGGAVAVLAIVGVVLFLVLGGGGVPDVTGKNLEAALKALDDADLKPVVSEVVSEGEEIPEAGTVLSQDPVAGADKPEGGEVALKVETFAVEVPNVVNMSVDQAEEALAIAELVVGEVVERDARSPTVNVLGQAPTSGERVLPGTAVELTVARQKVRVPGLVGQSIEDAKATLGRLGLRAGKISDNKTGGTKGTILSTNPAAGESVSPGHKVALVVETDKFKMPNVIGNKNKSALKKLNALGLKVVVVNTRTQKKAPGTVLGQTPTSGKSMSPGDAVSLSVEAKKWRKGHVYLSSALLKAQITGITTGQVKVGKNYAKPRIVAPETVEKTTTE